MAATTLCSHSGELEIVQLYHGHGRKELFNTLIILQSFSLLLFERKSTTIYRLQGGKNTDRFRKPKWFWLLETLRILEKWMNLLNSMDLLNFIHPLFPTSLPSWTVRVVHMTDPERNYNCFYQLCPSERGRCTWEAWEGEDRHGRWFEQMVVLSTPRSFDQTHSEDRFCQSRHRHAVVAAELASMRPGGNEFSSPSAAPAEESQAEAAVVKVSSGGFRFITVRARGLTRLHWQFSARNLWKKEVIGWTRTEMMDLWSS